MAYVCPAALPTALLVHVQMYTIFKSSLSIRHCARLAEQKPHLRTCIGEATGSELDAQRARQWQSMGRVTSNTAIIVGQSALQTSEAPLSAATLLVQVKVAVTETPRKCHTLVSHTLPRMNGHTHTHTHTHT